MRLIKPLFRALFRLRSPREFLLHRMPNSAVCAEIGVYRGDFSAMILKITSPHILHLIDPWKFETGPTYEHTWYGGQKGKDQANMDRICDRVRERFKRQIDAGVVCIHRRRSVDAADEFADEYFDWIYVDGNHLYEFVKRDLSSFHSKLKHGGFIAGDDYTTGGWWKGGVKRAVDEFVASGMSETVSLKNNQFILRKP